MLPQSTTAAAWREWAHGVAEHERQLRHGKHMAEIREALEALPWHALRAVAAGDTSAVADLPQFDRLNRSLGCAEGRTVLLARDLQAERDEDLSAYLERCEPDLAEAA